MDLELDDLIALIVLESLFWCRWMCDMWICGLCVCRDFVKSKFDRKEKQYLSKSGFVVSHNTFVLYVTKSSLKLTRY